MLLGGIDKTTQNAIFSQKQPKTTEAEQEIFFGACLILGNGEARNIHIWHLVFQNPAGTYIFCIWYFRQICFKKYIYLAFGILVLGKNIHT